MERSVVTAVRYFPNGTQDSFMMGLVDTVANAWVVHPTAVPVIDVVDLLMAGSVVISLFPTPMGLTPGPLLRVATLAGGVENVSMQEVIPGRSVADLPAF